MSNAVYTIGHSSHPIAKLVTLLKQFSITALCDVRSQPYSRMNPQFNRETLRGALKAEGIAYVFLGKELGARPDDKSCYRDGQVQYDLLSKTDAFKHGLQRVRDGSANYLIALMCAEKDPLDCHRTILVARPLAEQGAEIRHILASGQIEEHDRAIERLIDRLKIPPKDFYRSRKEIVAEAYRLQANLISFQEKADELSDRPDGGRGALANSR